MKAEILSIGTELLLGNILDTNAQYLAQRLAALGIDCHYVSQVGDNLERITEVLRLALSRSDLVVATGGLGPTSDDLTREAIAHALGQEPFVDPELERNLRLFFATRGVTMPQANLKQASLIPSARPIANPVGTAPGWWVTSDGANGRRQIVAMPGVPFEMKRMWEHEVEPGLVGTTGAIIVSRTLKTIGLGESAVEEAVSDLMVGVNPTLAPYAKSDGVHLRMTAKAAGWDEANILIGGLEAQLRARLGDVVYGADDDTLAGVVAAALRGQGLSLVIGGSELVARGLLSDLAAAGAEVAPLEPLDGGSPIRKAGAEPSRQELDAREATNSAKLLLEVNVAQGEPEEDGVTVRVEVAARLATVVGGCKEVIARSRASWRTAAGEATRLATLAALNLVRRHVATLEKGASQAP